MFTVLEDMRILNDKALKHYYMSSEIPIFCKHGNKCP